MGLFLVNTNDVHPNMIIRRASSCRGIGKWGFVDKQSTFCDRLVVFVYTQNYAQKVVNEILRDIQQACLAQLDFGCTLTLSQPLVDLQVLWMPAIILHGYRFTSATQSEENQGTTYHFVIPQSQIRATMMGKESLYNELDRATNTDSKEE